MTVENSVHRWRPREKPLKKFVIRASLFALGTTLEWAAVFDPAVRAEVRQWKDPFSILFAVLPDGPYTVLEKRGGRLVYKGSKKQPADLTLSFKTVEGAFLVMTGQIGTPQSYAEHRATLKGDTVEAMSLIRCLNAVQAYLFPGILAKRVLKRTPEMTPKRWAIRAAILGVGLPAGLRKVFR
jgi:hypothetical protein